MSASQRFLQDFTARSNTLDADSQDKILQKALERRDLRVNLYSTSHGGKRNLNIVMETFDWRSPKTHFQKRKSRLRMRVISNRCDENRRPDKWRGGWGLGGGEHFYTDALLKTFETPRGRHRLLKWGPRNLLTYTDTDNPWIWSVWIKKTIGFVSNRLTCTCIMLGLN